MKKSKKSKRINKNVKGNGIKKKSWSDKYTYSSKPNKWSFVSIPMIYTNEVGIYDVVNDGKIGKIEVRYKLNSKTELDKEWFEKELFRIFGIIPKYVLGSFERDKSPIEFIKKIFIDKDLYVKTQRRLKFERILNENYEQN